VGWEGAVPPASREEEALSGLSRAVRLVAVLNLAYFGVEFVTALRIGSVSLLADSVDFIEDASINLLIMFALGWSLRRRAQVGVLLSGILLLPVLATIWAILRKLTTFEPPSPLPLSVVGLGALGVNLTCALLLARFRQHRGSLTRAAFLSARNDTVVNIAVIVAGALTAIFASAWPDLVLGVGVAALNAGAPARCTSEPETRAAPFRLGKSCCLTYRRVCRWAQPVTILLLCSHERTLRPRPTRRSLDRPGQDNRYDVPPRSTRCESPCERDCRDRDPARDGPDRGTYGRERVPRG